MDVIPHTVEQAGKNDIYSVWTCSLEQTFVVDMFPCTGITLDVFPCTG